MTIPTQAEDLVLVPREPSIEMLAAFWRVKNTGSTEVGETGEDRSDFAAYRAMISAVPSIGGGEGDSSSCADRSSPQMANPAQSPFAWRDISSAPRDGTRLMVLDSDGVTTAHWCACQENWSEVPYNNDERSAFTHWMPLPPAPSTEAPPLILSGDEGPSCADSGGSQPQEAVKSDGPRGLGGERVECRACGLTFLRDGPTPECDLGDDCEAPS